VKRIVVSWTVLLLCLNGFAEEKKEKRFSFLFVNDFTYQNNQLADENDQFYNLSTLFLKYGNWSGGLTLRSHNYYKRLPNRTLENSQYDLYRKHARYATKSLEFQVGDFNSMLGRGLVLSVLQNDKALRDRTVLGGDFRYNAGGWQVRALGGSVEDELKRQKWHVAGGELAGEYWKGNRVGVHASYIHDEKTLQRRDDRLTWSVSWSAEKLPGGLSYYAEISRLNLLDSRLRDGSACYSNLGWTRRNVSLLLEYRKYRNFNNELNNPPSADRGDEAVELRDSEAARLYVQYSFFRPDIVPFISVGRIREFDATGPQAYGGVNGSDVWGKLDFSFSHGVRETYYPERITEGRVVYRFTDPVAVDVYARDKRSSVGEYRFNEIDYNLQVSWAPHGAVFFQKQYSRELIDDRHHFHSGGIRINLKRDSYFELSVGETRGGEVCSSGQCVILPPFRGWRLGVFVTVR